MDSLVPIQIVINISQDSPHSLVAMVETLISQMAVTTDFLQAKQEIYGETEFITRDDLASFFDREDLPKNSEGRIWNIITKGGRAYREMATLVVCIVCNEKREFCQCANSKRYYSQHPWKVGVGSLKALMPELEHKSYSSRIQGFSNFGDTLREYLLRFIKQLP